MRMARFRAMGHVGHEPSFSKRHPAPGRGVLLWSPPPANRFWGSRWVSPQGDTVVSPLPLAIQRVACELPGVCHPRPRPIPPVGCVVDVPLTHSPVGLVGQDADAGTLPVLAAPGAGWDPRSLTDRGSPLPRGPARLSASVCGGIGRGRGCSTRPGSLPSGRRRTRSPRGLKAPLSRGGLAPDNSHAR